MREEKKNFGTLRYVGNSRLCYVHRNSAASLLLGSVLCHRWDWERIREIFNWLPDYKTQNPNWKHWIVLRVKTNGPGRVLVVQTIGPISFAPPFIGLYIYVHIKFCWCIPFFLFFSPPFSFTKTLEKAKSLSKFLSSIMKHSIRTSRRFDKPNKLHRL